MPDNHHSNLTSKVLVALFLGIVAGLVINLIGLNQIDSLTRVYLVDGLFLVIGTMFVNALKMLVVPLVFLSLLTGVCGIGNLKILGRVGSKSFILYLMTTALAIAVAIGLAANLGIGGGLNLTTSAQFETQAPPPLKDVLINIIPSNPIAAMANGDMLPLIFFSILLGVSLLMVGQKASGLITAIEIANEVMMKMVMLVMLVAPYAVFALIARAVSELGIELLGELAGYASVLVVALLIHLFVTQMLVLKFFSGLSPAIFLKKIRDAQVFAFSTASSNATIPVTLRAVTERMGVDNSVASFTVPFGATINMDGTAIMQGVATVFIANVYGLDLGVIDYLIVIVMSVLASIGTAGVPGVGLIMLSMVFSQVGLPIEGIGLVLGIDRLMDMLRTVVNISGDAVVTTIVAKSENKLDSTVYNDVRAGSLESYVHIDEQAEQRIADKVRQTHGQK